MTTDALPDRANPNPSDATDAVRSESDEIRGEARVEPNVAGDTTRAADAVNDSIANSPSDEAAAVTGEDQKQPANPSTDTGSKCDLDPLDIPSEQSLAFFEAQADRMVESFRPSWEPPLPVATPAAQTVTSATPGSPPSGLAAPPAAVVPDHDQDSIPVPGLRPRRQGMLIAVGAVICFGVLAALAVRSGGVDSRSKPTEKPPVAAISIPEPEAQQAAPPADLAVNTARAPIPSAPADLGSTAAPTAIAPTTPAPLAPEAPSLAPAVPSAVPPPPTTTPTPEPPAAVVVAPAAAPPTPVVLKMARVRITTSPKNAELLVDGTKASNPFDARLPAGSVHQVHAQAQGHLDQDVTLTLDRDRTLALRLNKVPAPAPTPVASKPRPQKTTARPRTPRPVVAPTASTERRTTGAGFVSDSPY